MYARFFKRLIDVLLSFLALILLSWLFLILVIAIKIDDPGPAFFTQKRVGKNKSFFKLHKFRSMKMSTPHDVPTHMLDNPEQYITKVGKFLRKSSLDELPQIWDIFVGKMSIIGPRPALWNQDDLVAERDKYGANDVMPGLTGWAQINGRDELEIPEKAKLDGEYAQNLSFVFDLRCFFGTFASVLTSRGYAEGVADNGEGENRVELKDTKPFENKIWLSSPTMHGDELRYIEEAYKTNWMSTIGENLTKTEELICEKVGCKHAVPLATGTSALHMAVKLAGVKRGDKVFCSDMTFSATVNPIVYEGGEPVFIDSERDTWNMDPKALEKAFEIYPDVKVVVCVHLYGTPAKVDELKAICDKHNAILIEDAAESLGATYKGKQTGTFGKYNVISFNGNKIITGSSGGMLLTDDTDGADKVKKWSTQSREAAPWYQHEDLGYNYRMSNVIGGVVRGQIPYLEEHIAQKKAIYYRYKEGLKDLPITMNPINTDISEPNFWLSCMIIDKDAMCDQQRSDTRASYNTQKGKSCPTQILETLEKYNAEGRPIWKPMHMQPIFKNNEYISTGEDVGADIFERGLCLPSDNKMTQAQQDIVIEIIKSCFD